MSTPEPIESPYFLNLVLIGFFLKAIIDFKSLGGFNYPLLIKLLYMILIIVALVMIMLPEEMKKAVKQTKIEDYFKKKFK